MAKTKLMGILNVTPDSIFARTHTTEQAISRALHLEKEGADIIDIGGESTRPGSAIVSESEELERVIPVIKELSRTISIPLSIDTMKPKVAKAAIEAGASLINDVTGFSDPEMVALAKETELDICVMHMQGNPRTMQDHPIYEEGIIPFLFQWFRERTDTLISQGVKPEKIILDPGIGFGKTVADNLKIIHNLPLFKELGFRLLLGASRKWFLSQILDKPREELLAGTLAVNTIAVSHDVDIIRVHDVKEHRSVIDFFDAFSKIQ